MVICSLIIVSEQMTIKLNITKNEEIFLLNFLLILKQLNLEGMYYMQSDISIHGVLPISKGLEIEILNG